MAKSPPSRLYTKPIQNLIFIPLFLGIIDLALWQFHETEAFLILSRGILMNPMTAVGMILASFSILALRSSSKKARRLGWVTLTLCVTIALSKIAWFAGIIHWSIDLLFFSDTLLQPGYEKSRMAPNTCLNFVLCGFGLLPTLNSSKSHFPNLHSLSVACFSFVGLTGLMAFLNFVYDIKSTTDIGTYIPMALPTSISFIFLALGQLLGDEKWQFADVLLKNNTTGFTIRRLSIGAVIVPITIGGLTQAGKDAGLFDSALSLSISCVLLIACFLALIIWTGRTLYQQEIQKADHEREIHLLTNAHFESVVVTIDGVVEHANRQYCQLTGYELEEVTGTSVSKFFAPQSSDLVTAHILTESEETYQAFVLRKDGTQVEIEITPRIVNWHGQRARISVIRDITRQRAIERLKDEFVSVVSHELRTPVTSIHGSLGLLAGKVAGELPATAQTLIDLALRNSERLILLINDLLDIQKIESGQMKFVAQEIDLPVLLQATVAANASYAESLDVRFETQSEVASLLVHVDPDRLAQVITNLLSNAAKFSPKSQAVQIRLIDKGAWVRIEVQDHGPGISDEFQQKIFQKFAQADSSATRSKGGTGLGLSISKAIME
ncbi:MAG: PAS domain S-box protein, partial [Proteobacteria bacterium]